jgi:ComF family protein
MRSADNFLNHAQKMRDFILDFIFPRECLGCGQDGGWLCQECFKKLAIGSASYCFSCKRHNLFGEFCPRCQPEYYLDGIWIAGDYDSPLLSQLIKNLKYHFTRDIAPVLGDFMSIYLYNLIYFQATKKPVEFLFELTTRPDNCFINLNNTLIIPVPLHKKREKWRGFNQAGLIAEVIAKNFSVKFNDRNLIRIKNNQPQVKYKEAIRKKNIIDCFVWTGEKLTGQNIILIDDIATTGSTLNECAKILKSNGAKEVWGLVAAKG